MSQLVVLIGGFFHILFLQDLVPLNLPPFQGNGSIKLIRVQQVIKLVFFKGDPTESQSHSGIRLRDEEMITHKDHNYTDNNDHQQNHVRDHVPHVEHVRDSGAVLIRDRALPWHSPCNNEKWFCEEDGGDDDVNQEDDQEDFHDLLLQQALEVQGLVVHLDDHQLVHQLVQEQGDGHDYRHDGVDAVQGEGDEQHGQDWRVPFFDGEHVLPVVLDVVHLGLVVLVLLVEETQLYLGHDRLTQVEDALDERREHVEEHVDDDDDTDFQVPVCR